MSPAKKLTIIILCLLCFQTARADWVKRESGTLAWLRDVYFLNETKGFIAGGGAFLQTEDGGKTWKAREKFTGDTIERIYFSDAKTGWLLCQRGQFNRGADSSSYLMKTADGGAHWEQINFGTGRERITGIFSTKNNFVMAVGESGVLLALRDDGKKWKRIASPTRHLLLDGKFTGDFHGAIVGAGGTVLFTEDAGASWNSATIQGAAKPKLNKVFFINKKSGWTIGGAGKIYQTINGGKSWREQNSGTTENLIDVFFSTLLKAGRSATAARFCTRQPPETFGQSPNRKPNTGSKKFILTDEKAGRSASAEQFYLSTKQCQAAAF